MNFKRILVLVMTFAMLLGTFAPTLGVFATERNNDEHNHDEKKPLIYVSIGDSMTNGYGLPGYDGVSGILNYGVDVYSNQFAAWLAGYTGEIKDDQVIFEGTNGVVDHRQLAMSGLLAEDLHWLLDEFDYTSQEQVDIIQHLWDDHSWTSGPHHAWFGVKVEGCTCGFCKENPCCQALNYTVGLHRTYGDLCDSGFRMADGVARMIATYMHPQGNGFGYYTSDEAIKLGIDIDAVYNGVKNNPEFPQGEAVLGNYSFLRMAGEFYQESVRDADIISLALGNTNFGTFMFDYIKDVIADPNDKDFQDRHDYYYDIYDHMMDSEVYTPELKAEIEKLMVQIDNMIEANFDAEMFDALESIKYIIRYCVLSYIVNYIAVVNSILRVNPDVELIQVALMNAYAGASAGEDDGSLAMADMIDMLYNPLNAFIAAVPSLLKNGGQYPESKFYYADCGTVETLTAVFGDDFYYDSEGEFISYPGLDLDKIGSVNTNSVVRDRFQYWISGRRDGRDQVASHFYFPTGGDCSYGEMWKHVLDELFVRNTHHYHTDSNCGVEGEHRCVADLGAPDFFGKYDLMYMVPEDLVAFSQLTEDQIREKLTGSDKKEADWAFTMMMYLMFENALIVAGEQSFTINGLSECKFNYTAFDGAFSAFAQELYGDDTLDYTAISSNEIPEGVDVLDVFRTMSDALLADPVASSVLCIGSRMEIGTGIGGHPSQGGHDHMYEAVRTAYENEYTSEDKLAELLGKTGLERVYFALLNNEYLTMTQSLEIVNALSERFDLANLGDIELTQDDKIYVIDYIYNYLLEKNVEADARIDIIKTVYVNLKGDLLADFSPALDTLGAIYTRLTESALLNNEAAFNIVDFVYDRVIDFKVDDQDVYQIATYIYKTLFFTKEAPAFFRLARSPFDQFEDYTTELGLEEKIEIINIVFDELKNSAYLEETPELAPVVELYEELKADKNVGDEAIILIVDMAFESISERTLNDEEVDTEELVTEVTQKILTTDELDITAKATIANKVVETIKNSTLPGGSSTVVVPEIPDLTKVANILNVLKNKGYIDESDINTVLAEVMDLLVKGEFSVDTGIELVKLVYDLVLADLTLEEKGQFAVDVYDAIKAEYDLTDEEVAKLAVELVSEYYDEAYFEAYKYLNENGYIDVAVSGLGTAIDAIYVAIEAVDGFDGISDELKAALIEELYATIATLEELMNVLNSDSAEDVEGFVDAIIELGDDLRAHLGNIYAILEQAGIDYVLPELERALNYLETVVIPEIQRQVDEFVTWVVNHVTEKLHNAIDPLVKAYLELVLIYTKVCGTVKDAIRIANTVFGYLVELNERLNGALECAAVQIVELFNTLYEIYGNVENALRALNDILMDVVEKADQAIADAITIYKTVLDVLVNAYGAVENAVIVAGQIFSYVYDFVVDNAENLVTMYNNIVAIVVETYGATKDAYYVASQVYAYIANEFASALEGNYVVTNDSKYVSLGNAVYGEDLAEMLQLADKYYNFDLDEDYLEAIVDADLITVKFDNGEAIEFVLSQLNNPTEIDWNNYLDAEGQEALDEILANIKAELLASGKAQALANAVSELAVLPGIALTAEIIADVIVYTIEGALYSYAEFIDRVTVTLNNVYAVAPEATVVITGIQNPLADLDLSSLGLDVDLGEYAKAVDYVVKALNVQLLAVAVANENTVFVESNDAQDIYDALNVEFNIIEEPVCPHAYDDCEDTTCNLCGEERVAPGHSFTNYTYNNDATCGVNGTETAKCDNCDAENTREAQGTALTHKYGEWVVVKEATTEATGLKERTCEHCGHKETEVIPMILPTPTPDPEPAPAPVPDKTAYWIIAAVVGLLGLCFFIRKPVAKKAQAAKKEENKETSETESTEE